MELRDDDCHPADALPVDQVELVLRLPACLFHARTEERAAIGKRVHDAFLRSHPTKDDWPS